MTSAYRKRPIKRKSHVRDAKLIIIATEGEKTEAKYFSDLTSPRWFGKSTIQVEIIPNQGSGNSPKQVFNQLDLFRKKFKLDKYDELWLVVDVDNWGDEKLSEVARLCVQKKFHLAVSNPCFELWLLLHLVSLDRFSPAEKMKLLKNSKVTKNRNKLDHEILKILGKYNKANLDSELFLPNLEEAITRAEKLDTLPKERWPSNLGSHVYKLAKSIILKGIS